MAILKEPKDIALLRDSGKILVEAIQLVQAQTKAGISTAELDALAKKSIERHGAQPAFLGYHGYPASICISINEEVVHGIPKKDRIIVDGDVVGLDIGVSYRGFFTDHAVTVAVGNVDAKVQSLLTVTQQSLLAGIDQAKSGNRIGDIGAAIEKVLTPKGYGIIRQLCGHGVGRAVHEEPEIPNYGKKGTGVRIVSGMVLAIEPMVALGGWEVETLDDGWTVVTADGSVSAHFEHTVLVTDHGPEIMTNW